LATETANVGGKTPETDAGGPAMPRPSTVSKWRALVLVLVHVAIAAHVAHWLIEGETLGPVEPSEAITFSKNSVITTGLVFFLLTILSTLILGRFFCGWACHVVAVQDLCLSLLKRVGIKPKQIRSRALLLVPIAAFVYMFLYPVLYRLWHGVAFEPVRTEFLVEGFWDTFPPWPIAVATLAAAGFGVVYFLGAKGFCTNLCPYGAIFGVADRLSPGSIRVTSACEGCGHCTQVCSSNVVVHSEVRDYGMVVDQECLKCLDCVSVCPKGALYFGFGKPALFAKPTRSPKPKKVSSWWKVNRWHSYGLGEELVLGLLFATTFFTFRGLYNSIPFLFALAIAALFTYFLMQAARLAYKRRVQLQGLMLKDAGVLTGSGRFYCGVSLLLVALWGQSAYVHYHRSAAEAGYIELNEVISGWLNGPQELDAEQQDIAGAALEHALRAERMTPFSLFPREEWELSLTRGWLHLLLGDEPAFAAMLERAARVFPQNATAADGLANYYAATERRDEAEIWFEHAALASPRNPAGWRAWSRYLTSVGDTERARAVLVRATGVEDAPHDAQFELGQFEVWQGALPAAAQAFEAALALEPGLLAARLQLAGIRFDLGQFQAAVEHYETALVAFPEDFQLRLNTTLACSRQGDLERASEHAQVARELRPDRPEPYVALSQIAEARGDSDEAQRLLKEAERRAAAAPPQ
jgi:tetratricopeptide (TPR) repeat protein/ferredoxin